MMKLENKTVTLRILKPSDGHWLTNGDTYSKEVYLGKEDSPEHWREITEAEYEEAIEKLESDGLEGITS